LQRFGCNPAVHFVETSPVLRQKQQASVPDAVFHDSIETIPRDAPLLIVANEFFDALPVRQMIATHAGWRERVVVRDYGTKFAALPGTRAVDDELPNHMRVASVGSIYETCPDACEIMHILSGRLREQGGVMLTVDYGYTQPALGSTLQAVRNHQYADPFANPGDCDLTVHVDFSELARQANSCGLNIAGPVNQGSWLTALGVDQRAQKLAQTHPDRAVDISAARNRLVQRDAMGALFKVLATYSEGWPKPEGFGI
jgi:SAM-dependent MidA family methyltransferase